MGAADERVRIGERLRIAPEIRQALAAGAPVVALETTIVSHGMPYPENVETALALERKIRGHGATPATIAVLDGLIRVGLSEGELDALAQDEDVLKLSRNDLACALVMRRRGSTTVAATMICAQMAGIRVLATGGIGGVHRGAAQSFDISADLEELAQTAVAVVLREHADSAASESMAIEPWKDRILVIVASQIWCPPM